MNAALKWIPLALAGALALAGCARDGFYDDRNLDYVESAPAPPLTLPETRDQSRYQSALPIPADGDSAARPEEPVEARAPRPLTAARGLKENYVTTRKIRDRRWLVVADDAASVWPRLERFARTRAGGIERSRPSRGVLETREGTLRLDSAVRPGASEVHCERAGQPRAACLERLERYLASQSGGEDTLSSLNAQRVDEQRAVQLRRSGDDVSVRIPYSADRTWAEIAHYLALDFDQPGERELLESDAASHSFTVNYQTLDNRRRGVLAQLNPFADDSARKVRLTLEEQGDQSRLRVQGVEEPTLSVDARRELLERVSGYLR
ncbi:lipoprotein, NlpB [Halomonas piscis]|uniref:lipoprotein, NlpB n=1 Tax=Halomonas piscis TaxID=3031727 RepID=UPI00289D0192|nr:lipoprotein, NlpB [Halomonas piscis]